MIIHNFTCVADMLHRRRLRSASTDRLYVPTCRLSTVGDRAFPVAGAKVWNGLPSDVASTSSLAVFKNRLKTYLFRRCYETVWNCYETLFPVLCPLQNSGPYNSVNYLCHSKNVSCCCCCWWWWWRRWRFRDEVDANWATEQVTHSLIVCSVCITSGQLKSYCKQLPDSLHNSLLAISLFTFLISHTCQVIIFIVIMIIHHPSVLSVFTRTWLCYVRVFGSLLSQIRLCRLSVCLSACNVRAPYSGAELFGNNYFFVASFDLRSKFYGDRPRRTLRRNVKRKSGSKIQPWWTYRRLYLINGTRYGLWYN